MAFIPVNYEEGDLVLHPMVAATYTKGQALTTSSGNYTAAAIDQDGAVEAVCMEGVVIATSGDKALCITTRGVKFLADCVDAPAQTDVSLSCDLDSATQLDPDSVSDNLFFIESIDTSFANGGLGSVGTSTRVFGYFQHENLNA